MKFNNRETKSIIIFLLILFSTIAQVYYLSNFNIFSANEKKTEKKNDNQKTPPYSSSTHPPDADDFSSYKEIVIDHTKVSGTGNLIDFPLLISIFDSDLHTAVQPDGDDIAFSNDFQMLDHEIELFNQTFNSTHAQLIAWVRIPVLSPSEDTIIRMYYGNPYIEAQENPEGVWDSKFAAVWHMNQFPPNQQLDSTSNDVDLDSMGSMTSDDSIDVKIGIGVDFDGINDGYYSPIGTTVTFESFTFECWCECDSPGDWQTLVSVGPDADRDMTYVGDVVHFWDHNSNDFTLSGNIDASQMHHIVVRYDDSLGSQRLRCFVDGTLTSQTANPSYSTIIDRVRGIAYTRYSGSDCDFFNGLIDEVRISNIARSADWIQTEYYNQDDPNTFYSVGSPKNVSVPSFNDFKYYKVITIDHNKVSGTNNLLNFPVLISIFDSDLRTEVRPDGNDIAFTNGTTWLDHEIELFNQTYNETHAQFIAWIRVPSLSPSSDTKIWMYYGNDTMSSQESQMGVWDNNYKGVWHLNEEVGPIHDSTQNGYDGSVTGASHNSSSIIDGGYEFIRDETDYIIIPDTENELKLTDFTAQAWIKTPDLTLEDKDDYYILTQSLYTDTTSWAINIADDVDHLNEARFTTRVSSQQKVYSNINVTDNKWHHIVGIRCYPNLLIYVDGILANSATDNEAGQTLQSPVNISLGSAMEEPPYTPGDNDFNGLIDEVRISDTARSADWIKTEYDNQNDPNTFYSITNATKTIEDAPPEAMYFRHYKIINIDHTRVFGSGSHSNFPVLIYLEDSDLHDSNKVQANGDDIAFALGSTWLDHEIELFNQTFNSTHAQLTAWVRIPQLSTSIDTTIRMYYGNSTMDSQENPTGVWNANYMGVWHLSESSGNALDSTSYGEDGAISGAVTRSSTGQIDGAYEFGTDGTVNLGDPNDGHFDFGTGSFTVSIWINVDSSTGITQLPLYKGASSTSDKGYCFSIDPGGNNLAYHAADGDENSVSSSASIDLDEWMYIVGVIDRNNDKIRIYKNGTEINSGTNINTLGDLNGTEDLQFSLTSNDFDGILDEIRISDRLYSDNWILTEYLNQHTPGSFYSIGSEISLNITICDDLQVNAIDLYGNPLINVNISMYRNSELIRSAFTDINGSVFYTKIDVGEYNFTASMTSDIGNHVEIINTTSETILINETSQTVDLICNVSTNFFNIIDIDGIPVDSGWIIVGNSSHNLQNCTIDSDGTAKFWWVNVTPYEYNYTVHYLDTNYNPQEIILASGDLLTPNSTLDVKVNLTTVDFFVEDENGKAMSGVKVILRINDTSGASITNLTTDITGKATLRWLNSSALHGNYSLQLSFFGGILEFNSTNGGPPPTNNISFIVSAKATFNLKIYDIDIADYGTEIISLNPKDSIAVEWEALLKLRFLFNVSKAKGHPELLGPAYADSMTYQLLFGITPIYSGTISIEEGNPGRHQVSIDTTKLESGEFYLIRIFAQKSGFSIPSDLYFPLQIQKIDLILNQTENDDSLQEDFWLENIDLSVKPYGEISEEILIEDTIFQDVDHSFSFVVPEISSDWNLSRITFNIYNISWNIAEDDINITIVDPNNEFWMWHETNATVLGSQYNYLQGWWKGITLDLDTCSPTGDNLFNFTIGGSFDSTVDIVAYSWFLRDKVNVEYSQFNVTDDISIISDENGWVIKNITFTLYNCRNITDWSLIDPITAISKISTNDGYNYTFSSHGIGTGKIIIDNITIYPVDNQFLFDIIKSLAIMFDVNITVEYYQGFYWYQRLENISIRVIERGVSNGGEFSIVFNNNFEDQGSFLLIKEITDGIDYFYPSELAMNITIGGQTYSISNTLQGEGSLFLGGFTKDMLYLASIETNQAVNFTIIFSVSYVRTVCYETSGTVSFKIREEPDVFGSVLDYYTDASGIYFVQTIDTSLINAGEYTVEFTVSKDHYNSDTKELDIKVMKRLTLINGVSTDIQLYRSIYVQDAVNYTFSYNDAVLTTDILNLDIQEYRITIKGPNQQSIDYGAGNLDFDDNNNKYILDINTETLKPGIYTVWVEFDKQNYVSKFVIVTLTVNMREIDYELGDMFEDKQVSVVKGKKITLSIELTDPTQGDIPLKGATVILEIEGDDFEFEEEEDGVYELEFKTDEYEAFFTSNTITGTIKISKANYTSEDTDITIVIEMEELVIIPGLDSQEGVSMPTFYLLILLIAIIAVVGSLATYKYIQLAKIPKYVKKIRSMKAAIKKSKMIPETLSITNKEGYLVNMVSEKWGLLGLSIKDIFEIPVKKRKILPIFMKESLKSERNADLMPSGLLLMKWDERIGTEILAKYPEDIEVTRKTLMQIYGAHEYTGESGMVNLIITNLNLASYYAGPEKAYYLVLILNLEDDADAYEGGMADTLQIILQNLEDDAYISMIPTLFRRLAVYPTFNHEQQLMNILHDKIKQMTINRLRDEGIIEKSELMVWLKDQYKEGLFDLEVVLIELVKREIIKQVSVKGFPSELNFLTGDLITLRTPPIELLKDPEKRGLPSQLTKVYLNEVKTFFEQYTPTEFDNLKILNILTDPEVYQTFQLLRSAIVTKDDLEKLKKKGVENVSKVLKLLWDANMIKVLQDKSGTEYYALQSDFYIKLVFPKYILEVIKQEYEQKSKSDKELIEYLNVLENTYLNLKAEEK